MADLPTLADRLNDIEISANAPVTESLMRRIGSNINFLLDFLGVSDGASSPTGLLSDIVNAFDTIENHTITKQGQFGGNVTNVVGTYPQIKYVNRLFWARNETGGITNPDNIQFLKSVDGGPNVRIDANPTTPSNITTGGDANPGNTGVITSDRFSAGPNYGTVTTGLTPYQRYFTAALGVIGYEHGMRNEEWSLVGRLNWREGNSVVIREYHEPGGAQFHCYMSYELDLRSAPIIAP